MRVTRSSNPLTLASWRLGGPKLCGGDTRSAPMRVTRSSNALTLACELNRRRRRNPGERAICADARDEVLQSSGLGVLAPWRFKTSGAEPRTRRSVRDEDRPFLGAWRFKSLRRRHAFCATRATRIDRPRRLAVQEKALGRRHAFCAAHTTMIDPSSALGGSTLCRDATDRPTSALAVTPGLAHAPCAVAMHPAAAAAAPAG
jgi:hypothetical protein